MKKFKLLFLLLVPLLLTGCYDRKELDDLAYVIAIGIDKGEGKNLDITYQVSIPLKLSGTESSTGKENYTTYTVSAPSLYLGNSIVNTQTSKEINLANVKLIIYSEELAKEDLSGHISELMANVDIRPKTTIAICEGKTKDFLSNLSPVLESSTARFYELFLAANNYTNLFVSSELFDFYKSAQSIDRDAHAIILKSSQGNSNSSENENKKESSSDEKNEIQIAGIATFDGGKMTSKVPIEKALSHLILTNTLKRGTIGIEDINEPEEIVTFTLTPSRKCSYKIDIKNDTPNVKITTYINAHILSSEGTTDYINKENRDKLKISLENKINNQLINYLEMLKEIDSDITALGKYARINYLTWEDFEEINWKEIFKNSKIEIKTNVNLNISETAFHRLPNV